LAPQIVLLLHDLARSVTEAGPQFWMVDELHQLLG
jgi:hypothetical protein